MRISVAVMAHPSRGAMVDDLLARLAADTPVVWDQRNNVWETGRRALLAHDPEATHHLVIQDDAIPAEGLLEALPHILTHIPGEVPVGLYIGAPKPAGAQMSALVRQCRADGTAWLVMPGPRWGPGVVIPTSLIRRVVTLADAVPLNSYDARLARAFATLKIDCWYPVPSLVDHRTDHTSLFPNRTARRSAHWFIGDQPIGDIDWSRLPTLLPANGYRRGVQFGRPHFWCLGCGFATRFEDRMRRHQATHGRSPTPERALVVADAGGVV